jgi:hypothetical protein
LVSEKGYDSAQLPSRQTIGAILNRMGYRLKKHNWFYLSLWLIE